MSDISVKNLTKIYGANENRIAALNDVSFDLSFGELTVILGPSGSGKSTLLNILGGMDTTTFGEFSISDKTITNLKEKELVFYRRNDIGFVFQFYNLLPILTALENVQLCETDKSEFNALKALELVGLENRANHFPGQLSGGEQQRVSIARAIIKNPKLLLCDEPTGALDSKTGRNIIMLLQKLAKDRTKAVVVVSHNSSVALAANRIIRLSDGKIVEDIKQNSPLNAEEIEF